MLLKLKHQDKFYDCTQGTDQNKNDESKSNGTNNMNSLIEKLVTLKTSIAKYSSFSYKPFEEAIDLFN